MQLCLLLVVQARCMLPAHVILTHPLRKPLVWAFSKRWPPPPPMEGLMGYDLPFWVLLPDLLLLWAPTQATVIVMLVWLTGGIGESRETTRTAVILHHAQGSCGCDAGRVYRCHRLVTLGSGQLQA